MERKWMAVVLLSIAIPSGAFTYWFFRKGEVAMAETIWCDAVELRIARPCEIMGFRWSPPLENYHITDEGSFNLSTTYFQYSEDHPEDGDRLEIILCFEVNLTHGFVHSARLNFSGVTNSWVHIVYQGFFPKLKEETIGLEVQEIVHLTPEREGYVHAEAINQPKYCHLKVILYWHFFDTERNDKDHCLIITAITTFYNGTVYKQVIQPMKINVTVDPGETFETAKHMILAPPQTGELSQEDPVDMYAIYVGPSSEIVEANLTVPENVDFNLYLYNENRTLIAQSTNPTGVNEAIKCLYTPQTASEYSVTWYIKVERKTGNGTYRLNVRFYGAG